ncbi:cytochrome P450 [Rhodococcus sp. IEGM 1366]|uniref:cytochrome P450 n=1 Tax=Rhodococcus sp. IEGM 1366 TaxID=3082223 RepID=UPI0029531EB4|nr:cytochrome P450 [Rhodococcus sp. IEGM 1366]MDV8070650.1 cytochrome P450 [Rhodococcus sp. IEGM 1366]
MTIEQQAPSVTGITSCPHEAFPDFDHHSENFSARPFETMAEMRETCPIQHSEMYGGFWSLLDYQTVFNAARDDETFSSYPSIGVPAPAVPMPIPPIESNPPDTKEWRQIALRHFAPSVSERLRPRARAMATELVNEFIERGECDIVVELTNPLPARLILHMLGLDESKYLAWVDWVHTFVHNVANSEIAAAEAALALQTEIANQLRMRRESGELGSDLFGAIAAGRLHGQPLDDSQITMYTFMMMLGGMDTTSGLTGNALLSITNQAGLREQLIEDPDLIKSATDEFLRHSTPTIGLGRSVPADAKFHGQELKAGDMVMLMWAAANRDPEVFEDPDTIDLHRRNSKQQIAFGVGIHRCMGSHIARMMFQEMMTEIIERLPDFELNGDVVRFEDAGSVYAARNLPIKFTPGKRVQVAEGQL